MGMNSGINPSVVKTELDDVFNAQFEPSKHAGHVDATSSMIFRQDTADSSAEIEETLKGVGLWDQKNELQDVAEGNSFTGNQKIHNVLTYAKQMTIGKEFFDDNKHGTYTKAVADFGWKARQTRDTNALGFYAGGFDTYTTGDGSYIYSNTHTTLSGDTVDNLGTAVLAEDSLNTGIIALAEQKDQSGVVGGNLANCLIVPLALFKSACEIVDSELRSGTADNDMNVYSSKYGIYIATSPFLGSAAGGSNTAWFLNAYNNAASRWVREGISTTLVDWKLASNDAYIYKGRYREMVGATDYVGLWGSNGTV